MSRNPLRFRLSILAACLLAGAAILACATPNLEGLDEEPQATLPDRTPSLPTSDGGGGMDGPTETRTPLVEELMASRVRA